MQTRNIIGTAAKVFVIIAVTLAVYMPAIRGGFVWDDDLHLINNVALKENGLYRTWLTTESFVYYPVTWTSYYIEHLLWGLNPLGYHIVNVLLHIICSLLLWRILVLLKIPCGWLAALIFAIHPVNVETAAWIAQRKNLLSMMLFLLSLLSYLRFDDSGRRKWYLLALVSFILAMLSKGAVVMLPFVLLLLAWWLYERITRRDLLRSVPFFAVSVVMGLVEVWFQTFNVIGESIVRDDTLPARIAGAGWVVWFYIYKALLPLNLSFVYPRWQIDPANWLSYIPDLALLGLLIVFWIYRRSWGRPFLFAFGFFIVMVAPATGFAHFYFLKYSFVADHYQYMAIIGVIALVVATSYFFTEKFGKRSKEITRVLSVVLVMVLGILSWRQSGIYKDTETLWHDTLRKNPNAWMAHNNLGALFQVQGRLEEAASHYYQALRIKPDHANSLCNLGMILSTRGKLNEAIDYYRRAIEARPDFTDAYRNLGNILRSEGRLEEAINHYLHALAADMQNPDIHHDLGIALIQQGKTAAAIEHFREAVRTKPDFTNAYFNLGNALKSDGKLGEAVSHYLEALCCGPETAEIHNNLAVVLRLQSSFDEAISHYYKALELTPDYFKAHNNLGGLFLAQGKPKEAVSHFLQALDIKPDYVLALENLERILMLNSDSQWFDSGKLIEYAERAVELTGHQDLKVLKVLAEFYAVDGQFDKAIETAEEAAKLAVADGNKNLAKEIQSRIQFYRLGLTYYQR
jgi:tetratricopeptide (TPR) repeat protein